MPGGGGSTEPGPNDDVPWWMKYAGKGAGTVGGIVAVVFGVWCCISISPMCIVAGVFQIAAGLCVILIELPMCSSFIPYLGAFTSMVEARPPWQRALVYLAFSLVPIMLCTGLSTIIGSGLIFVTSVIYGLMTLGRKASREEMSAAAQVNSGKQDNMNSGLVGNIHGQDVEAARASTK